MLLTLSLLLSYLSINLGAPHSPVSLDENQLKFLSLKGQWHVVKEIKRVLHEIKHMKEQMDKTDEKHQQLLKTLKLSQDKKMEVEQLAQETQGMLKEAEQHCLNILKHTWNDCQSCSEFRCGSLYTSPCRWSQTSVSFQTEELLCRMASKLDQDKEHSFTHNTGPADQNQTQVPTSRSLDLKQSLDVTSHYRIDHDLVWINKNFTHIKKNVESIYDSSLAFATGMQPKLGLASHNIFNENSQTFTSLPSEDDLSEDVAMSASFIETFGSLMEEGRSVFHEVSSTFAHSFERDESEEAARRGWLPALMKTTGGQRCKYLRSQCPQLSSACKTCYQSLLTDCSDVSERYAELSEIFMLLNASQNQYEEILHILQTYTDRTLLWAENLTRKHFWITHFNYVSAPEHIFSLVKLIPGTTALDDGSIQGAKVEVMVLDSAAFLLPVPPTLSKSDPMFIQNIAHQAFFKYQSTLLNAAHWSDED